MIPADGPSARHAVVARWLPLREFGIAVALALALPSAEQAVACDWWWPCGDRAHVSRPAPWAYGYRGARPGYGWAHGYSNPARGYGDVYAAWSSTSIPPSRWYERTAPPVPNANAVGLTVPIATQEGLLSGGGLPARGPSLFGPNPPPAAWAYRYGGPAYGYASAYGAPTYGYAPPGFYAPPPDTASWWVEPRRRR